jgi:hypothetical protein
MANIETLKVDTFNFAEGAAPATPASGQIVVYAKANNRLYAKNDLGEEFELTGGGSLAQISASKVYAYTTFRTAR